MPNSRLQGSAQWGTDLRHQAQHFGWDQICGWDWRDGWYASGVHTSCTQGCRSRGLTCTDFELANHNGEVDTTPAVLARIREVGGSTVTASFPMPRTTCDGSADRAADVPCFQPGLCYRSAQGRELSTFDCDAVVPRLGKTRLCWCHTGAAQPRQGLEIFINYG